MDAQTQNTLNDLALQALTRIVEAVERMTFERDGDRVWGMTSGATLALHTDLLLAQQALNGNATTPHPIRPGSFWLVIYEHRPSVITIAPDGSGFFACGQEELWPLREIKGWIREINVIPSR